ncbi:MAG: transcription antitermination factor NusB [Clostridia bacterium]|nr:transcription antitermination factor NusB [Clostridia bacterium]
MLGKRKVRKNVFQLIFGYQFNKEESPEEYYIKAYDNFTCEDDEDETVKKEFIDICNSVEEIDSIISENLNEWKLSRLSNVTATILRVSVYEMKYIQLPPAISINEAVEMAKEFAEDGAAPFINGVLNNIAKKLK